MTTSYQLGQHFTERMQMFPLAITVGKTFYITHLLQKNIVGMFVGTSVNAVRGQSVGIGSPFLPCGFQELNLGCQDWWQVP